MDTRHAVDIVLSMQTVVVKKRKEFRATLAANQAKAAKLEMLERETTALQESVNRKTQLLSAFGFLYNDLYHETLHGIKELRSANHAVVRPNFFAEHMQPLVESVEDMCARISHSRTNVVCHMPSPEKDIECEKEVMSLLAHPNTALVGPWQPKFAGYIGSKFLKRLILDWTDISEANIRELGFALKANPKLEMLSMVGCGIDLGKSEMLHDELPRTLHITCVRLSENEIADMGVLAFVNQHTASLQMRNCHRLTDGILGRIVKTCHNLTELDFSVTQEQQSSAITAVALGQLSKCPQMQKLHLQGTAFDDDAAKAASSSLPFLTLLNVTKSSLGPAGLAAIAKTCTRLEIAHLGGLQIDDKDIQLFLGRCLRIHSLVLRETLLTHTGFFHVARSCNHRLTHLDMSNCNSLVSTDALQALARFCPSLTTLNLASLPPTATSDDALCSLFNVLTELQVIDLSNNPHISDKVLDCLAKNCSKLVSVSVAGTAATDVGVGALVSSFGAQLTQLDVSCCPKVTDKSLSLFAKKVATSKSKLHTLSIGGSGVTDKGVTDLATAAKSLMTLNATGCKGVTDKCRKPIKAACADCTIFL